MGPCPWDFLFDLIKESQADWYISGIEILADGCEKPKKLGHLTLKGVSSRIILYYCMNGMDFKRCTVNSTHYLFTNFDA